MTLLNGRALKMQKKPLKTKKHTTLGSKDLYRCFMQLEKTSPLS